MTQIELRIEEEEVMHLEEEDIFVDEKIDSFMDPMEVHLSM